jgi:hypothetical protein
MRNEERRTENEKSRALLSLPSVILHSLFLIFQSSFLLSSLCSLCLCGSSLRADPPVASYIFPAGGQRGKTVAVRIGGLNLLRNPSLEMLGPGVKIISKLQPTKTVWFEGPLLPLPDSQQQEDYPKDYASSVQIAANAPLGIRSWRLWNAQGATPSLKFVVGDLPEIVEEEIDGKPVPVEVKLPVTINGRIFPRENVDIWSFEAKKGQEISCEVYAARLGSPLDSRLEVLDPQGKRIAENDDTFGADSFVRFTAAVDGKYQVRIHDINFRGGQAYVYRLTLTAEAYVDRAYPLGGRRGSKVKFELAGQGLPKDPVEIALPSSGPREFLHRLSVGGKLSNVFLLDLDDLPEYLEAEPNDQPAKLKPLSVPAVLNGRIDKPGDVDYWAITLQKSQMYELELRAARLGSPLDGVLTLFDASGKELARAESAGPAQPDPILRYTPATEGTYYVRVSDRFRTRGGTQFAYRLRVDHSPTPDFRLRLATDALTVNRGGVGKLKILAERRGGFKEPITLTIEGLPKGASATPATLAANQTAVEIPIKAEKTAAIEVSHLTIHGSAKVNGQQVTRTATLPAAPGMEELTSVLFAVALPTPFKIKGEYDMRWAARGTVHQRHYKVERNGFDGPIEVSLADRQARHLQGVTGPKIVVPPGVSEFDYAVQLPPWMEMGRTCRVCVMGVARVKDEAGHEHFVCFSSTAQNEQIVAVIEPGRLSVETDKTSLVAIAGKTVTLPVRASRGKGLKGDVKLELIVAEHLRGLSADPVIIPASKNSADFTIRFSAKSLRALNMPVILRATVLENGRPVIAEMPIEIQSEK